MKYKILYIMSSFNIYGGTPKKTLDLMRYFGKNSTIYIYHNTFPEFKSHFEKTGGKIHEGFYNRNIFKHLIHLLKIIDEEKIDIIQTQFFFGELLAFFIKLFRPKIKVIVAFVGPFKPTSLKSILSRFFYKQVDFFVHVSKYVKNEKIKQFPVLKTKQNIIIYNGTEKRTIENKNSSLKYPFMLTVSALIEWKNIQIVIQAISLLKNQGKIKNFIYYIAGEGKYRNALEKQIEKLKLTDTVLLLGNQTNIGFLLEECSIFLHPSYAEGFGIAVAEAMLAQKPIIVSNAGALPELIEHKKTGLVINPHNKSEWANAILELVENKEFADKLALNAKINAEENFSIKRYVSDYEKLYQSIIKN